MLYFLIRGLRNRAVTTLSWPGYRPRPGIARLQPDAYCAVCGRDSYRRYMLHSQSRGKRVETFWGLVALAFAAFIVFLTALSVYV
jgi:hypothetical protein